MHQASVERSTVKTDLRLSANTITTIARIIIDPIQLMLTALVYEDGS
jgi:hypothetical protein